MRKLFIGILLLSMPTFAQRLASRYAEDDNRAPMQGLYAAIGGGGALIITDIGNGFGYDLEARLGYSFNPGLQLYMSGSMDAASIYDADGGSLSFRSERAGVCLHYHLFS